jgi:4-oxalomesaconate tautomerase
MQQKIPFMVIRGGSSKGVFFRAEDLSLDENVRNEQVIKALEGTLLGDPRQIDGLGGATTLTSKVAIISKSEQPDVDLDYLFIQVVVGKGKVSAAQTCGNLLAGVLHFALEMGMIPYGDESTSARINIVNTGGQCEVVVQNPQGQIQIQGSEKVDGVVGTGAPVICNYLDTIGSTCGALLPTSHAIDLIEGVEVTCIDNGMPIVLMKASDFGLTGNESKAVLEENESLKQKIEAIRIQAGIRMNLGDVKEQTIPKMCLISEPMNGGFINTRMFIPYVVHEAIGVLAAVSVATACVVEGSVCQKISTQLSPDQKTFSIEHPSGEFTVNLDYQKRDNQLIIRNSGVLRTSRIIAKGEVYIPVH